MAVSIATIVKFAEIYEELATRPSNEIPLPPEKKPDVRVVPSTITPMEVFSDLCSVLGEDTVITEYIKQFEPDLYSKFLRDVGPGNKFDVLSFIDRRDYLKKARIKFDSQEAFRDNLLHLKRIQHTSAPRIMTDESRAKWLDSWFEKTVNFIGEDKVIDAYRKLYEPDNANQPDGTDLEKAKAKFIEDEYFREVLVEQHPLMDYFDSIPDNVPFPDRRFGREPPTNLWQKPEPPAPSEPEPVHKKLKVRLTGAEWSALESKVRTLPLLGRPSHIQSFRDYFRDFDFSRLNKAQKQKLLTTISEAMYRSSEQQVVNALQWLNSKLEQ